MWSVPLSKKSHITRGKAGSNDRYRSILFNYLRLHSILQTLYTIARIEWDRSPSKYVQNEAHRMTSKVTLAGNKAIGREIEASAS
jgi:hypothetical protein